MERVPGYVSRPQPSNRRPNRRPREEAGPFKLCARVVMNLNVSLIHWWLLVLGHSRNIGRLSSTMSLHLVVFRSLPKLDLLIVVHGHHGCVAAVLRYDEYTL